MGMSVGQSVGTRAKYIMSAARDERETWWATPSSGEGGTTYAEWESYSSETMVKTHTDPYQHNEAICDIRKRKCRSSAVLPL
jgi:hypothetical protein